MPQKPGLARLVGRLKVLLLVGVRCCVGMARAAPADPTTIGAGNPDSRSYVEIDWQAPNECPDSTSVKAHTERLLGQPLHAAPNQRIVARARVRRNDAGNWELSLSLASNEQVADETLIAQQCDALADATALKVALAIDPLATARAIEASAQRSQAEHSRAPRPRCQHGGCPIAGKRHARRRAA